MTQHAALSPVAPVDAKQLVVEVDDASFEREVLASEVPVLVDFSATWCGPCRALDPILRQLAAEQAGKVKVVRLDTDASPATTARYGIRSAPTLLVLVRGEKRAQHVGLTTKERILRLLALG